MRWLFRVQRRLLQDRCDLGAIEITGGEQGGGKRIECAPVLTEQVERRRVGAIDGAADDRA